MDKDKITMEPKDKVKALYIATNELIKIMDENGSMDKDHPILRKTRTALRNVDDGAYLVNQPLTDVVDEMFAPPVDDSQGELFS